MFITKLRLLSDFKGHILCRVRKAGLQGQLCKDIYIDAQFAPVVPVVMRSTAPSDCLHDGGS